MSFDCLLWKKRHVTKIDEVNIYQVWIIFFLSLGNECFNNW